MNFSAIWIEGERNLNEFCQKRFKSEPHFVETVGHCDIATIYKVYKEIPNYGYYDFYLVFMKHDRGALSWGDVENMRRMSYEQIRVNRGSILVRRGRHSDRG